MTLTAGDILGPGGHIAQRLPNYEHRGELMATADAVAKAILGQKFEKKRPNSSSAG
jgi:hypothetical protein